MKKNTMPSSYTGKEQAYIKHTLLKGYLQRLSMIVGRQKFSVINYVDCFSGPWEEQDENLKDTSIAVSLAVMNACRQALQEKPFDRHVRFRALYIEQDVRRFAKLQAYLQGKPFPLVETHCLHGDYTKLISDILAWHQGHFSFFFVDPTGWKGVVSADVMAPLLRLPNTEFLINLMYEFINRFVDHPDHPETMEKLFGEKPDLTGCMPEERQDILINSYRNMLKTAYGGRSAYVRIEKPGTEKLLYALVYLSRSPMGIDVFKAISENLEIVQRRTRHAIQLRKREQKSGIDDLFGIDEVPEQGTFSYNQHEAREILLQALENGPTRIDWELWADWLEAADLYPRDFQEAMKALLKEGLVKNLSAETSRRSKNVIKLDWFQESEVWTLTNPNE